MKKKHVLLKNEGLDESFECFSRASADIQSYIDFFPATDFLFKEIRSAITEKKRKETLRHLHSLKGLFGIYSFNTCGRLVHLLEEKIEEIDNFSSILNDLSEIETVFKKNYGNISSILSKSTDASQLQEMVNRYPLSRVLSKYIVHVKSLASKLNKKVDLSIDASVHVSYDELKNLDIVFTHLINNSIDHGIDKEGVIAISAIRLKDNSLIINLRDNGKGIDHERMSQIAMEKGFLSEEILSNLSTEEKNNLIFVSGFSTKDQVTQTSGRGIGMFAVKAHIEALEGSIELFSEKDRGTIFTIKLPPKKLT